MNKAELNSVFEWIEPSHDQKEKILHTIITSVNPKFQKHNLKIRILKIAASLAFVFFLAGTTVYATGYYKTLSSYFSIDDNFISWATDQDLLKSRNDSKPAVSTKEYDEVYSYNTIEEALQAHDLNIAIPKSHLLSYSLKSPTVKVNHINSDLTEINFSESFVLSDGNVDLMVDCYITKDAAPFGLSTSLQADNANTSKYRSESGAEFTLLESNHGDTTQTTANIMVRYESTQTYFYLITFTNVAQENMEEILDSIDLTIYETE